MPTTSQMDIKWKLPSPNQVRKVKIPYGMLKGTYEISLGELTDTSSNVLTPYFIRENYDSSNKFVLRDFPRLFYSNSDIRGSGIELVQYQHLIPLLQTPKTDQMLHDSLKGKWLYTDSASVRQGERFFMGKAYVAENGELSIDLERPFAETAFSDGLVNINKIDKYTLWKPISQNKVMEIKAPKHLYPTNLYNYKDEEVPNRFVDADFRFGCYVVAGANGHPLDWSFSGGARSVKKIE